MKFLKIFFCFDILIQEYFTRPLSGLKGPYRAEKEFFKRLI